jgi:hypothetical protein
MVFEIYTSRYLYCTLSPLGTVPINHCPVVTVSVRDILVRIRIFGSVPLTCDPFSDPDPAFLSLGDNMPTKSFFLSYFVYYFFKVHLHQSSKIKSQKEVTK